MKDQASNLRILMHEKNHQRQVPFLTEQKRIVVVSGKGGVGKSFFSLHLAYALKSQNEKVLLIDSNLQNPSLHILTNSDPIYPVNHWIAEAIPIDETALIPLDKNLDLLGNNASSRPQKRYFQGNANIFLEVLTPLASRYNYIVVDTQTGLGEWNLSLMDWADVSFLLSITDPTSVIDTYTLTKAVLHYLTDTRLELVINQVIDKKSGLEAYHNLNLALQHFLDFKIELASIIPFETEIREACIEQKPLWERNKTTRAMREIKKLAQTFKSRGLKAKIANQEATI